MAKSPDAFRTISEVAEWLDVPTHVLRFWESRFTQIKPVKRAGGRRYYRPTDMELLGGIKRLLHDDGLTIRGVQKLLREEGVRHVAGLAPTLDREATDTATDGNADNVLRMPGSDAAPDRWPFVDEGEAATAETDEEIVEPTADESVVFPEPEPARTVATDQPTDRPARAAEEPPEPGSDPSSGASPISQMEELGDGVTPEPVPSDFEAENDSSEPDADEGAASPADVPPVAEPIPTPAVVSFLASFPGDDIRGRADEIAPILDRARALLRAMDRGDG